jgi:ribulose 1,5-bisphosphate synthetase/thiazole synthase
VAVLLVDEDLGEMTGIEFLVLVAPDASRVLESMGAETRTATRSCHVAVVGAGSAGLTAAVYAASEGLDTLGGGTGPHG